MSDYINCMLNKGEVIMRTHKGLSLLDFPKSFIVIDIETTGLDPSNDSLIEVGALKVQDEKVVDTFSSLINPGVEIDSYNSSLTGITNEELADAPSTVSVLEQFSDFIGDSILMGHNVHFDINFLYDNFEKYLSVPLSNDFVDTLRLSKRYFKEAPSHKLTRLADYLHIEVDVSHRALADCYTTLYLYKALFEASTVMPASQVELLNSLEFDKTNPFYNRRIVVKGIPQLYSLEFMKEVADKCHARLSDVFYNSCDYAVFSHYTYNAFKNGANSKKFIKAKKLVDEGSLEILSEEDWCKMLGIPIPSSTPKPSSHSNLSAKDITTENTEFDETHPLYGKTCVFTGALEKMPRKDAMQIVVDLGGLVGNSVTKKTNYLILGNNDYCSSIKDGKSSKHKKAEALKLDGCDIEIISENVFYDMIEE